MLRILHFSIFLIIPIFSYAQETNIWYFGEQAGLDFNFTPPKVLLDGALNSHEGSAIMADKNGKLLFYTNGETVWNSNHQVMENGMELGGDQSARQSSIIVPKPNTVAMYYIFTMDAVENRYANGLMYSIVDLNANNGLGKVIEKKVVLQISGTESLSVVGKCRDGEDPEYWVVAANIDTPTKVYTYKIDSDGINPVPVISPFANTDELSYIKFSPAGNKAVIIDQPREGENIPQIIIADFHFGSGKFYNLYYLKVGYTAYYNQAEFSGNGKYLYISDGDKIKQVDLVSSNYPITATVETSLGIIGDFQLAPDGNIYIASLGNKLSIIKNPNERGLLGKYEEYTIDLKSKESNLGLPNFVRSYLYNGLLPDAGSDTLICSGQTIKLGGQAEEGVIYQWHPAANLNNINVANPIFQYKNTSDTIEVFEYVLTATNEVCSKKDTVKIQVYPSPPDKIAGSRSVCPGVVGVEYSVPQKTSYSFQWEVEGGVIVAGGEGSATILVDWGPANAEAKVTLTSTGSSGCETSVVSIPVRINVELDTETPQGFEKVCANLRDNIPYSVTNTNGSVYTWDIDGGIIKSGQGTHQVIVDWDGEGIHKLWLQEKSVTIDTVCYGISDTLEILVYKDFTEIAINYVSISLADESISEVQANAVYGENVVLYQREWGTLNWEEVSETKPDNLFFTNSPLRSDEMSYEYKISMLNPCKEEIESVPHRTILLSGEVQEVNDRVLLRWNAYEGWSQSVEEYEIWRRVDHEEDYQLLISLSPQSLDYDVMNGRDAFTHYYRIKAVEKVTGYASWSNELTLEFIHDIFIPSVFTPNGDGYNDTFIIDKLELYPENEIIIFNRWGEAVYSKKGYSRDWDGENLPSGIYYYSLKLKVINRSFKGWVHLLRADQIRE